MEKKSKSKKIYIVLTYTGTFISKIIRLFTRAEYCHVSLSLDKKLKKMYSFGRLNPYNPFIGGFVHEGINHGTFKRFKRTKAEIYEIQVTNIQYNKIRRLIKNFDNNKSDYKFNRLGLVLAGINYKYTKENSFYCSEFVKYLIEQSEIDIELKDVMKPIDFKNIIDDDFLYKGKLKNYN